MSKFEIDKLHNEVELFDYPFSNEIWEKKYKYNDENNMADTIKRVCKAIYIDFDKRKDMIEIMNLGLFMPGGRILAGAGTTRKVTLMNCYVNDTLHDSMDGIVREGLGNAAKTLQMGGGIGTDFSPLRPKGAELRQTGTGAIASGPISFMEMFNSMSLTVMSAGERRGAMMGTISDTHPDLIDFITAKQTQGVLTQFNISVLISDEFMRAVACDGEWKLYFSVPPVSNKTYYFHDNEDISSYGDVNEQETFEDENNVTQYVYAVHNARYIWNLLMESAHKYSEPGVIFIDTINLINNLKYCEDIRCTNPCGEQPLPPNGTCNLGAINLSRFVDNPFTKNARVNYELLNQVTAHAIEFLDLVIDVTMHPLDSQAKEQKEKRRIGLGVSGLADLFSQLGIVYGSEESIAITNNIMIEISASAYSQSINLAKTKGKFGLYEDSYWKDSFAGNLVEDGHITRTSDLQIGIRNSHLLTIAPTGTTSILYGNISSGLEPVFSHSMKRKVKNYDGTFTEHENTSYIYRLYNAFLADNKPASNMIEGSEFMITVQDDKLNWKHHLYIQAACQQWIDASVSKTINLPENITLEEVKHVYLEAYKSSCKGCTIFRPSEVRGSIIEADDTLVPASIVKEVIYGNETISDAEFESLRITKFEETPKQEVYKRSSILHGMTGKLKWPSLHSSIYITVNFNDKDGRVFEIFFSCKDHTYGEWLHALGILFSICIQAGAPINKICREMMYIHATNITIHEGKFTPSLIHAIANKILEIIKLQNDDENDEEIQLEDEEVKPTFKYCKDCATYSVIFESGCEKCTNCGVSKCD